jgi:hypothetical protein
MGTSVLLICAWIIMNTLNNFTSEMSMVENLENSSSRKNVYWINEEATA